MGTPNALPHGICVGMGLAAEVSWATERGICAPGTYEQVVSVLEGLNLPILPPPIDAAAVLDAVSFDKKVRRGKLVVPVVEKIGQVRLIDVALEDRMEFFHSLPGFSQ